MLPGGNGRPTALAIARAWAVPYAAVEDVNGQPAVVCKLAWETSCPIVDRLGAVNRCDTME